MATISALTGVKFSFQDGLVQPHQCQVRLELPYIASPSTRADKLAWPLWDMTPFPNSIRAASTTTWRITAWLSCELVVVNTPSFPSLSDSAGSAISAYGRTETGSARAWGRGAYQTPDAGCWQTPGGVRAASRCPGRSD